MSIEDTSVNSAAESSVPQAITDKFDEVFSNATAADNAEAGLTEEKPALTQEQTNRREYERNRRAQEEQDELTEEGIISADNPDGAPEEVAQESEVELDAEGNPVEQVASKEADDKETSAIDPSLRMAAKSAGWTDEKIDRFFKADPELAQETLAQLADTYTNLSRSFLQPAGSPVITGTQQAQAQTAQPTSPTSQLDKFYSQIEAFAETNGEELASFAKSLKAELIDPVRELLAANEAQRQELHATEARTTLTDLRKDFSLFYGKDGGVLSPVEQQNIALLGKTADQLIEGAKKQGYNMPPAEAMKRAHLLVTAGHRDQIVRKQIKEQVQTRARGITSRPTQRTDPKLTVGRSKAAAMEAASRKMAEIGLEE